MRLNSMLMMSVCAALLTVSGAAAEVQANAPAAAARADVFSEGRRSIGLTHGWRFQFGDPGPEAAATGFDDAGWETVEVPHTWNRVGRYGLERAGGDNRQGVGWYRLAYTAPQDAPGRRQYLDFAAVGNIAEVWVNGTRIGEHRGAYSRFRFDVTAVWKPGARNVIAVRADNSKPAPGSSTADVLPLSGDFFIYGGLYRNVTLVTAEAASIDLLDHGGPGVYARATDISAERAEVEVLTRLRNSGTRARRLTAVAVITDADGRPVAQAAVPVTLGAGPDEVRQTLVVPRPRLWNGVADPYLYAVTVRLMDGRRILDTVTQPLGLRSIRIDPDAGFFLNGVHLPLHGVSRHADRLERGAALTREDHAEDMRLIVEMGANTVRGAHYEHDDAWMQEADRAGMVVWAEVPFISASAFDGGEGTAATFENAEQQTIELIRQQYNHPSIAMWSTGNEVDASALFLKTPNPPRPRRLLEAVTARARAEDPSRPTVFADCCEDSPFATPGSQSLTGVTDLIGYNRYYGWYYGAPSDTGPELDKLHAKHPQTPISISEYGAGGALSQHSDDPQGAPIAAFGRPHPEEFQSWYHEQTWNEIRQRPYIFASWVWNMFDFASDLREEGDAIDLNDKGLVTFDRKTRKDAFYFYQANWTNRPVLHLNSKSYTDRPYPTVAVRAYSNAERATLQVNGESIGETACAGGVCTWPDVALKPGDNLVSVSAEIGGRRLTDEARWNAPDARDGLAIDVGSLAGRSSAAGRRFGSDTFVRGGAGMQLNMGGSRNPHPKIVEGATDRWMFDDYREGDFTYRLPLPDGAYTLTIHSFEPDPAKAETRSFDVLVDGVLAVEGFNPAASAGGALRAATRSIPVTVRGGALGVAFHARGGPAVVAALEISR